MTAPDLEWPSNAWLTYADVTKRWGRQADPKTRNYIAATPDTITLHRAEVEDAANTLDLAANWMEKAVKDKRIIGPEFHVPTLRKAARALTGEPS